MVFEINLPEIRKEKESKDFTRFIIEPLYPGYGMTVGNALRRVLLSSLPGAAITAVKIEGAQHEFSTLPGIKEDVVTIILALKQVRLKSHKEGPEKIYIDVKGKHKVSAADIKCSSDIEIVNPSLYIATLDSDQAKLKMEMIVEQGRGYQPVERQQKERSEIGTIAIDAIFSPVKRVSYAVENTRVGGMTNFDKLTLDIWTDGSITPAEALEQSSKILVDHFSLVAGDRKPTFKRDQQVLLPKKEDFEKMNIEEIDFSTRTLNALVKNGVKTLGELKKIAISGDFSRLKGFGVKAQEEVREKLLELGFIEKSISGEEPVFSVALKKEKESKKK